MLDKIIVKNLEVFAHHGVHPEEKILGQKFLIDAILYTNLKAAVEQDDLSKTINYSTAIKVLTDSMSKVPCDLIEKTVENLAKCLFLEFESLEKIKICLKKPMAPIDARFDYVAVQIKRSRKDIIETKL